MAVAGRLTALPRHRPHSSSAPTPETHPQPAARCRGRHYRRGTRCLPVLDSPPIRVQIALRHGALAGSHARTGRRYKPARPPRQTVRSLGFTPSSITSADSRAPDPLDIAVVTTGPLDAVPPPRVLRRPRHASLQRPPGRPPWHTISSTDVSIKRDASGTPYSEHGFVRGAPPAADVDIHLPGAAKGAPGELLGSCRTPILVITQTTGSTSPHPRSARRDAR